MSFFVHAEGEAAILVENGVYRQVELFTRDGYLFAKLGSGFVRLMADGSTSKAKVRLDFMTWDGALARDAFGKLCAPTVRGSKDLDDAAVLKLTGPAS